MLDTALISADVAVSWINTIGSLKNLALWTEAALLGVVDHSWPHLVERVEFVVLAGLWYSWTTSVPFLVGFTGSSWTLGVVVITEAVVRNNVLISPVVDAISTIATALLSKVIHLFTTGHVG